MSTVGARRFFEEMSALLQKSVTVTTTNNHTFVGLLTGFDPESLSVSLGDVKDEGGKVLPKLFINGNVVAQMWTTERPFDLKRLAERLERVFPKLVKSHDDVGVIVVMDKIRMSQDGILEGTGPAAERAKRVYDEFMKEIPAKTT